MRRRRPSAAALDGGPPRDPEVHPSMWEMQMADELDGPQDQGDAGPEGSHYYRDMADSGEFSKASTQEEWVPFHILRLEQKVGSQGQRP